MILQLQIDLSGDDAMNARRLHEILQSITPEECEVYARFEVDEQDDNASFSVVRVE